LVASFQERLAMAALALATDDDCEISAIEGELGKTTYTVRTLEALARGPLRGHELFFLMGADSMEEFHTWREFGRILALARPVVLPRPGHRCKARGLSERELARFVVLRGFSSSCSSTKVRRELAEKGHSRCLDGVVFAYLRSRGLYGMAQGGATK
jgi:nicotinate-nucleotide adenylyltransferase